ncbi:hypothetical protein HWV62_18140 [Athelia sp. TMB]|nr:hypothetical protein HWV62_18140 [Athelia sp. TMB]
MQMFPSAPPIILVFSCVHAAYALAVNTSSVLSVSVNTALSTDVTADDPASTCDNLHTCRSLYSIIQTCLATIFACVWVAVHRNIPAPKIETVRRSNPIIKAARWLWSTILDQRQSVIVFTVTLLAPEWVLAWAVRQRLRARTIAKELEEARVEAMEDWKASHSELVNGTSAVAVEDRVGSTGVSGRGSSENLIEKRSSVVDNHSRPAPTEERGALTRAMSVAKLGQPLTNAHGFFAIMGGYHAYDKNGPLNPLSPDEVIKLVRSSKLVPPTRDELSNLSKGDVISKGVAILQTIAFVVQCIARLVKHLPLTNLEVMTLAYTVMTVAMYIAWWDKPLNISCAIRVPGLSSGDKATHEYNWDTIFYYIIGAQDDEADLRYLQRVPTFWAGKAGEEDVWNADIIALLAAMAFGAVHCIAWSYAFPSHTELLMWRVSSIAIAAVPAALLIGLALSRGIDDMGVLVLIGFSFVGAPVYICARTILLVLSFTTLKFKYLPYAVYQNVQWTEFIPHI